MIRSKSTLTFISTKAKKVKVTKVVNGKPVHHGGNSFP